MHAIAMHREIDREPVVRLRMMLDEPGGRRRLVEAMEERLGSALQLDDQQLLLRASALLDAGRIDDLVP